MPKNLEKPRLSRLTALITLLQSKRIVTAAQVAKKFSISLRTAYRDIQTLEESGVPIVVYEGKGYGLIEGYNVPPLMFTEDEANALLTAELMIDASKDESLIKHFAAALEKIKAVTSNDLKQKTEALRKRLLVGNLYLQKSAKSKFLSDIQKALVNQHVLKIHYTNLNNISSTREIEPFFLYSNAKDEWILIGYCSVRKELRSFLLNRINHLLSTGKKYKPYKLTVAQYRRKLYGD